jgi:hypothetical protein
MALQLIDSNIPLEKVTESPVKSTEAELLHNFLTSPTPKRLIRGITTSKTGEKAICEYEIGGFLGKVR